MVDVEAKSFKGFEAFPQTSNDSHEQKSPRFIRCKCGRQFWSATAKECPSCRAARAYRKWYEEGTKRREASV